MPEDWGDKPVAPTPTGDQLSTTQPFLRRALDSSSNPGSLLTRLLVDPIRNSGPATALFGPSDETRLNQGVPDADGNLTYKPQGSQVEQQGILRPLLAVPGRAANRAGEVAAGAVADVAENMAGTGGMANIRAAAAGKELPVRAKIEDAAAEEKAAGEFGIPSLAASVGLGIADMLPKIALLPERGATAVGGLIFGTDPTGNLTPKGVAIGALIPVVGKIASAASDEMIKAGIDAGATWLEKPLAQKAVRLAANQAAMDTAMAATDAPQLMQLAQDDPREFARQLTLIAGQNLAFAIPEALAHHEVILTDRQKETLMPKAEAQAPAKPAASSAPPEADAAMAFQQRMDQSQPANEPTAADSLRTRRSVVGQPVDAETTAFSPESQTLGIPREVMPQVQHEDQPQLRKDLADVGIATTTEKVLPGELKPSQAEFTPAKVETKVDQPPDRPIIVSSDNHVVDGHHDYVAALENPEKPVNVLRVDAPAVDAIVAVKQAAVLQQRRDIGKVFVDYVRNNQEFRADDFVAALKDKLGQDVHIRTVYRNGGAEATYLTNEREANPHRGWLVTTPDEHLLLPFPSKTTKFENAISRLFGGSKSDITPGTIGHVLPASMEFRGGRWEVSELGSFEKGGQPVKPAGQKLLDRPVAQPQEPPKAMPVEVPAKPVMPVRPPEPPVVMTPARPEIMAAIPTPPAEPSKPAPAPMAERLQVKPTKPVFTPERQKVFEQMADAPPESPLGRLSQWLGNERLGGGPTIREIADRKSYQVTGHVDQAMSDEIVHRLTTGALDYWAKHKDFHLGVGGFSAEQAATWAAQNEQARPARRAKVDSLNRQDEQGREIGDAVAAPAEDPATALHAKDLDQQRERIVRPILNEIAAGLPPAEQQAFTLVMGDPSGGLTKRNKISHDVRDIMTPEFRRQVLKDIYERLTDKGYEPDEIAQLLRFSVGQTADQPLSTTAMSDQVERLIQRLAPKAAVRVTSEQPPILGNRWVKGVTHADGTITLYSRAIHSPAEAREVLVEELGHLAVRDQRLRPLVDRLLATLTPEEVQAMVSRGYSPDVAPEEALQRRVVSADLSAQQRSLWQKLKVMLGDAWLKVTGRRSSDTDIRDLLRAALRAGKLPGGERQSVGNNVFTNRQELERAKAEGGAGDIGTIRASARATASLIPDATTQKIDQLKNSPSKADRQAARQLEPVSEIAGVTAERTAGLKDMTPEQLDTAARAVIVTHDRLTHELQMATGKVVEMQEKLDRVMKTLPQDLKAAELTATFAKALTKTLKDGFVAQSEAQAKLYPQTTIGEQQRVAARAAYHEIAGVTESHRAAVEIALMELARKMPASVNTTEDLRNWLHVQEASGWKAFESVDTKGKPIAGARPMDDAVFKFLVYGDPEHGVQSAIETSPDIVNRLSRMAKLEADKGVAQRTISEYAQTVRDIGGAAGKQVTVGQFAREFSKQRMAHAEAADEIAHLNDEFERADRNVRAAVTVRDTLEALLRDPEYQRRSGEAARQLEVRTKGVITHGEDPATGLADGTVRYKGPITGLNYTFDMRQDPKVHRDSVGEMLRFIDEVDRWEGDPEILKNPADQEIYRVVKEFINRNFVSEGSSEWLAPRSKFFGFLTGEAQSNPILAALRLPFQAMNRGREMLANAFPGLLDQKNVNRLVGGVPGRFLMGVLTGSDLATDAVRRLSADPRSSPTAITQAALRASRRFRTEGMTPAAAMVKWSDEVANSLLATNQNPGGQSLEIGDRNDMGHQITADDVAAVKTMKRYADTLRAMLADASDPALRYERLMTEEAKWFRRQIEYGLKMPRTFSDAGHDFAARWGEAVKTDALGGPDEQNARAALLSDGATHARRLVNSFWGTTNPEFWEHYKDKLQYQVARELVADRKADRSFNGIDDFAEQFGRRRAEIINAEAGSDITTAEEQTAHARDRLLQDVNDWVNGVKNLPAGGIEPEGRPGQGTAKPVTSAIDARSSFTEPRGAMVAPDFFYDYTLTEDARRLRLNAGAHMVFQMAEIERMNIVIGALERQKVIEDQKYGEAVKSTGPRRMLELRAYNEQRTRDLRAGEAITTRNNIDRQLVLLKNTRTGLLKNMEAAKLDELGALRTFKQLEGTSSVVKLATPGVQFTNFLSALFVAPVINAQMIGRNRMAMAQALASTARVTSDAVISAALSLSRAIHKPTGFALTADAPAWRKMVWTLEQHQLKQQADQEQFAHIVPETPTWKLEGQRMVLNEQLAANHGVVTREAASGLARLMSTLLIPLKIGSTFGGVATAKGERLGVEVQNLSNIRYLDRLRADVLRMGDSRKATGATFSQPGVLRPVIPADLGFTSHKGLDNLRKIFGPFGTLEHFLNDYYERADAARSAGNDPLAVPLLDPRWQPHVLREMLTYNNIVTDSGKANAMKGKGWKGFVGNSLLRFQGYPSMLVGSIDDAGAEDPRDTSWASKATSTTSVMVGVTALLGLAMANLWGKQQIGQLVSGKVPATTTPEQAINDPSAINFARVITAGGAGLFMPYFGDYVASLLGGQSRRPGLDLMQIVPGLGQIALVTDTAKRIFQTGDAYQPLLDLVRRTAPASEAVLNRLPGQSDLTAANNSVRALRSAIPEGLEARRSDGGALTVETPITPLIRQAVAAATAGDRQRFDQAVAQAVALKVQGGATASDARTAVDRSILAHDPVRTVYGKELTPEELTRATAGMTGPQLQAFQQGQSAFARAKAWTARPRSNRNGIFRQAQSRTRRPQLLGRTTRRNPLRYAIA